MWHDVSVIGDAGPRLPEAFAQRCQPQWLDTFTAEGFDGVVNALAVFNDGSGDHLYAADHSHRRRHTSQPHRQMDRYQLGAPGAWDHRPVFALAVFDDDGTGPHTPALYAAGTSRPAAASVPTASQNGPVPSGSHSVPASTARRTPSPSTTTTTPVRTCPPCTPAASSPAPAR